VVRDPATAVLDLVPPAPEVTHVMAWAEYGYAANLRLTTEHGFPLRLVVPHLYS